MLIIQKLEKLSQCDLGCNRIQCIRQQKQLSQTEVNENNNCTKKINERDG